MGRGQKLYSVAKKLIPGGTQLFSKRPELMLPDLWPAYYSKAKGCKIWDLDGKVYRDMSYMGVGASILGYAYPVVDSAVKKVITAGNIATLNCPEEVELTHVLTSIHPWADMARYARSGGEAMAIAVRIARASTNKEKVLFCGYHGWHDWYLAANLAKDSALDGHSLPGLSPRGVPRSLRGTAFTFAYNDTQSFLKQFQANKERLAAVIMEPMRNSYPKKGFLEEIRRQTKKANIPLILDEITAGWRLTYGGAHRALGINPDMAVFAKAISNGYPMAAIIGSKKIMQAAQSTFISSTYWTDRIGPAAALATLKVLRQKRVSGYLAKIDMAVQKGWKSAAKESGLNITITGMPGIAHFHFNTGQHLLLKTLYTQTMLDQGFLATDAFYGSYAHKSEDVKLYLRATHKAFKFISKAIKDKNPKRFLKGPIAHSSFKRVN